ncbi:hypothetical protein BGZ82_009904 [Podila clonocystis]|nr:hypothetical protein BGZ82_009904 [Podila clonocystis]
MKMVVSACIIIATQYLTNDAKDLVELIDFFSLFFRLDNDILSQTLRKLKEIMMATLPTHTTEDDDDKSDTAEEDDSQRHEDDDNDEDQDEDQDEDDDDDEDKDKDEDEDGYNSSNEDATDSRIQNDLYSYLDSSFPANKHIY